MSKKIKVTITTPTKDIITHRVNSFHFSTDIGEIELFPNHQSFASYVPYTILKLINDKKIEFYIIRRGIIYFENLNNEASINCLESLIKEEIDFINYKEYLDYINEQINSHKDESSYKYKFLKNEKLALVKIMEQKNA